MSEWKEKALHELVEVDPEQLSSSTDANFSFFYIDISSVSLGIIDFPTCTIMYKDAPSRARKILKDNDILMSTVRPNLKAFAQFHKKSKFKFVASTGFAILRSKPDVEIGFIYHSLFSNSIEKQIEALVVGSNYPSINTSSIRNLKCSIPNFSVQQKIAHILTTCDSVIERTQSAIAKYKAIKQGMLHDLFTRGLDSNGKLRPTFDTAPELYKSSELGMIPKEWEKGTFIDFADKNISYSFTGGPFGSDLQTKHYTKTGVRIIQLQNIGDGFFRNNYKIFTSEEKANQLTNCNIFSGEIIISKMAEPIARACIIPSLEKRYLMASDGIRLSIDKKRFNSRFVMETINHKRFRTIAEIKSTGSTRSRIGLTELKDIIVVFPSKQEIDAIGLRLDKIEEKIAAEETLLQKYQSVKRGLMGDLLGGGKKGTTTDLT